MLSPNTSRKFRARLLEFWAHTNSTEVAIGNIGLAGIRCNSSGIINKEFLSTPFNRIINQLNGTLCSSEEIEFEARHHGYWYAYVIPMMQTTEKTLQNLKGTKLMSKEMFFYEGCRSMINQRQLFFKLYDDLGSNVSSVPIPVDTVDMICRNLIDFKGQEFNDLLLCLPLQLGYYLYQVKQLLSLVGSHEHTEKFRNFVALIDLAPGPAPGLVPDLYISTKIYSNLIFREDDVVKELLQYLPMVLSVIVSHYDCDKIVERLLTSPEFLKQ